MERKFMRNTNASRTSTQVWGMEQLEVGTRQRQPASSPTQSLPLGPDQAAISEDVRLRQRALLSRYVAMVRRS